MFRSFGVVLVLLISSFSLAEGLLCSDWSEESTSSFAALQDPFVGFTETTFVDGVMYAGWYVVEADFASLLPFKAYFYRDVYTDGLEIGERFETPRSEWALTPFIDYDNMLAAFNDISVHAPMCTAVNTATN